MKYPKNVCVTKEEAIRKMIDGEYMFMTLWRNEMPKYVCYRNGSFCWDDGTLFTNINTMSGDFRLVTEDVFTSDRWAKIRKDVILDPDGWDRKNFEKSWSKERITEQEYRSRLARSTVRIS